MRSIILATILAALFSLEAPLQLGAPQASAEECTGENCPPKPDQGDGGHCERKEQTIS